MSGVAAESENEAPEPGTSASGLLIPTAVEALVEDLTQPSAWPAGDCREARRFFRYLQHIRQAQYDALLAVFDGSYQPFNPRAGQVGKRVFSSREREYLRSRFVSEMRQMLAHGGYEALDFKRATAESSGAADWRLHVSLDLDAFDELGVFRGPDVHRIRYHRRSPPTFRLRVFDVIVYERLFLLFKLKSPAEHVDAVMASSGCGRKKAEKAVRKSRKYLPSDITDDKIYLRLYRSVRSSDVEMIFPTTRVQPRRVDALMVGVLGLASFLLSWLGPLSRLLKERFYERQMDYLAASGAVHYFNLLAQDELAYRHLASDARVQDFKEEMLLYSFLIKEPVGEEGLDGLRAAVESYLKSRHGVVARFDIEDARDRLIQQGIVVADGDGILRPLSPRAAALRIDQQWDMFLDNLPDFDLEPDFESAG